MTQPVATKAAEKRRKEQAQSRPQEMDTRRSQPGPYDGILALQRDAGNQAVSEWIESKTGELAQADKGTEAPRSKPSRGLGLPWNYGDYKLFEANSHGIRFLVGIDASMQELISSTIPAIAEQIADDNKQINDAAYQVKTCIIGPTTSRFALYQDTPVLMLHPSDADRSTVTHEMGHALFYYLAVRSATRSVDAVKAKSFRLRIADIYSRLGNTKDVRLVGADGTERTEKAGYWMVDPSQWNPGSRSEHPWQNPDEFFASAQEAYQIDREALLKTIERFAGQDDAVREPANELIGLLDASVATRKPPSSGLPKARGAKAEQALESDKSVSKVEDTIGGSPVLEWLLNPETRP